MRGELPLGPSSGRNIARGVRIVRCVQYLAFRLFVAVIRRLSFVQARRVCGSIAKTLGHVLVRNHRAHTNLRRVFPDLSARQIKHLGSDMWEQLGQLAADYMHLDKIRIFADGNLDDEKSNTHISADGLFEVEGLEHLRHLRQGGPSLIFTGHFGSWEMIAVAAAQFGLRVSQVYRPASHPQIDHDIRAIQATFGADMIHKGHGRRRMIEALEEGRHLILLTDQRSTGGMVVPFLGQSALTPVGLAKFALRFRCPVTPARAIRLANGRTRITFDPPLELPAADMPEDQAMFALLKCMNDRFSAWIRDDPAQWLWIHNRWRDQ